MVIIMSKQLQIMSKELDQMSLEYIKLQRQEIEATENNSISEEYNNHTVEQLFNQPNLKTTNIKIYHNMSLPSSPKQLWSNRDMQLITKYKQRVKDIEELTLQKKLFQKEVNSIDFYAITPKEELPKFLQKMKFQTLHCKENVSRVVKVFKKERENVEEVNLRKKLKNEGDIMFLSEIYQNLSEPIQPKTKQQGHQTKFTETFGADLEEWEKTKNNAIYEKLLVMKHRHPKTHGNSRHKESRIIEEKLSQLHRTNTSGRVVNYFKQGSNYKKEIQKQLQIIYFTHSTQQNQVSKYVLTENSSKLLKKELDERQYQVQEEIKSRLKTLNETRIQHHHLFEERTQMMLDERHYGEEIVAKEHGLGGNGTATYLGNAGSKLTELKTQKRHHIEQNDVRINKNKRLIESLENAIQNSEEELRSIMVGEISYYKMSLKVGMDCRDTGLGWILKKLKALLIKGHKDIVGGDNANASTTNLTIVQHKQEEYEFPLYLDKKSKQFLIVKTHLEDQLEQLLEQKRKFVNEIGQSTTAGSRQDSRGCNRIAGNQTPNAWANVEKDKIMEEDSTNNTSNIPKKYRRSLRKITILNQQYAKNQSLLQFKPRQSSPAKGFELSTNTDGLSGKQLYQSITEKIKEFDFSKAKKDKSQQIKNNKLLEYQNLLKSIKDIHIKLEDLDIQHENHLTSHYKENKEVFFQQCVACFGYKKSYSMIIKYFSWKNGTEETGNV